MAKRLILSANDIIEWQRDALIVYGTKVLVEPKEVVRVFNLIKKRIKIIGKSAFTKSGLKLGQVEDIYIDTTTEMIAKYNISFGVLMSLVKEGQIIPANLVVRIQKKRIIFKDSVAEGEKGKAGATKTAIA